MPGRVQIKTKRITSLSVRIGTSLLFQRCAGFWVSRALATTLGWNTRSRIAPMKTKG